MQMTNCFTTVMKKMKICKFLATLWNLLTDMTYVPLSWDNSDTFQQFIWLVNEYKQKPAVCIFSLVLYRWILNLCLQNISVEKWLDIHVGNIIVEKPHTTVCFKVSQGYVQNISICFSNNSSLAFVITMTLHSPYLSTCWDFLYICQRISLHMSI